MIRPALCVLAAACLASTAAAQQPEIERIPVRGHVHMIQGRGGNIGVSAGDDGVFMIDDQFAPLTERILQAVGEVSDAPVRFLVNTHWHYDHTGGNENLGKRGAIIVAHENVRRRMSAGQFMKVFDRKVPPAPEAALPVVTFEDGVTFHWNGDTIRVFHVRNAHTDGDAIIHFEKADVIHTGDCFFNGLYPFIDTASGGTMEGMIAAADRVLALAGEETKIIPGHGPLSDKKGLRAFRDMLADVRGRILALKKRGKSADEVIAAGTTDAYDAEWGNGFLPPDRWVRIAYDAVKGGQ